MNILFNELNELEKDEDENIFYEGDSLLYQFYCGNWSASVKEMQEKNISCLELIEYIDEQIELEKYTDSECSFLNWFDRKFFAELGRQVFYG
mgnify:CR=1 FL=1